MEQQLFPAGESRLDHLSKTLADFGLNRDEEIIDKLNEIGGTE